MAPFVLLVPCQHAPPLRHSGNEGYSAVDHLLNGALPVAETTTGSAYQSCSEC